jgi:hypothetical protein
VEAHEEADGCSVAAETRWKDCDGKTGTSVGPEPYRSSGFPCTPQCPRRLAQLECERRQALAIVWKSRAWRLALGWNAARI